MPSPAGRFGPRVAGLIAAVTNPEYEADQNKNEQYRKHIAASLDTSPWARVIEASDFADNGVGLIHATRARVAYLASKYARVGTVLRENDQPARHAAEPASPAAHPGPARPGRGTVQRRPAARSVLTSRLVLVAGSPAPDPRHAQGPHPFQTQQGIPIARDIWMLGIGLDLVIDGLTD